MIWIKKTLSIKFVKVFFLFTLNVGVAKGSSIGLIGFEAHQMTGLSAQDNITEFDWINTWRTTEGGYPVLWWQVE